MWVSPFRYLRINAYLPLPEAFRSLSRLSSALSAKASALRSSSLNQAPNHSKIIRSYLHQTSVSGFNTFLFHCVYNKTYPLFGYLDV